MTDGARLTTERQSARLRCSQRICNEPSYKKTRTAAFGSLRGSPFCLWRRLTLTPAITVVTRSRSTRSNACF